MTTTLRARIDELRRLLEGHQEQEQEEVKLGRLNKRAMELETEADELIASLENARDLRTQGVDVRVEAPSPGLMNSLSATRHTTSESPLGLGGDERPIFLTAVTDYREKVRDQVDRAWGTHKQRHPAPSIDDELFKLASETDHEIHARYEHLKAELLYLDHKARPGPGDVTKRKQAIDGLDEIAKVVAEQAPTQSVVDFVRAAGSPEGAPLSALNDPDVRTWVAHGDRAARFRIRSRK